MESPNKSDEYAAQHSETVNGVGNGVGSGRPSKRVWLKNHLRRWWWVHVIIVLLCIALAVLLLIFVGVKNIAQSKINSAVLEVQGISSTNTHENNFTLSINSTLKGSKTKATVLSFPGVMYLEDEPSHTPFLTIQFPETHNQPFQTINISQVVTFDNREALTLFNTYMLTNESVRVTVEGYPKVKVPGISRKYGVHFKKTVTFPGLSNFDGIHVNNSSISISNFSDGTNFHTTVTIPNRSVASFEIGNVSFANFLNDSFVGTSWIDNVFLVPGDNVYPLRASIDQTPVLTAVGTYPDCTSGIVPFNLSGRTVVNNGASLDYFANALATHNTSVDIDLGTPLRALGLNPKCPS